MIPKMSLFFYKIRQLQGEGFVPDSSTGGSGPGPIGAEPPDRFPYNRLRLPRLAWVSGRSRVWWQLERSFSGVSAASIPLAPYSLVCSPVGRVCTMMQLKQTGSVVIKLFFCVCFGAHLILIWLEEVAPSHYTLPAPPVLGFIRCVARIFGGYKFFFWSSGSSLVVQTYHANNWDI